MKIELDDSLFQIRFTDLINFLFTSYKILFSVAIIFAVIGYLYSNFIFKQTYSGSFIFEVPRTQEVIVEDKIYDGTRKFILEPEYIRREIESRNYFINEIELNSYYDGHSKIKVSGGSESKIALIKDLESQIISIRELLISKNNLDLINLNERLFLLDNQINLLKKQIAEIRKLSSNLGNDKPSDFFQLLYEAEMHLSNKENDRLLLERRINNSNPEIVLSQKITLTSSESKPILSIFFGFLIGFFLASIFLIFKKIFREIKLA
jgi:hypothetical protein